MTEPDEEFEPDLFAEEPSDEELFALEDGFDRWIPSDSPFFNV